MTTSQLRIVITECQYSWLDEHDAMVTDIRHVKVVDAQGKLVMSCGGYTSVALCEKYVDGLLAGMRIGGVVVDAIEWPEADQDADDEADQDADDDDGASYSFGDDREDFHADG